MTILSDNKEGTVLLESEDGAFVMKATEDPAGPLFANFLYQALGVYVPIMRVLSFQDPNFKEM